MVAVMSFLGGVELDAGISILTPKSWVAGMLGSSRHLFFTNTTILDPNSSDLKLYDGVLLFFGLVAILQRYEASAHVIQYFITY